MNKYGPKAKQVIEKAMHEYKHGTLTNAQNNKKITDRQQALAIGISKAREKHYKVPNETANDRSK